MSNARHNQSDGYREYSSTNPTPRSLDEKMWQLLRQGPPANAAIQNIHDRFDKNKALSKFDVNDIGYSNLIWTVDVQTD